MKTGHSNMNQFMYTVPKDRLDSYVFKDISYGPNAGEAKHAIPYKAGILSARTRCTVGYTGKKMSISTHTTQPI